MFKIANKKERRIEAARRLREELVVSNHIVDVFEKMGGIYKSCASEPQLLNEKEMDEIKKIEKDMEITVYFVIRSYHDFGMCDNLLYISKYKDDWNVDKRYLSNGIFHVYCINRDYPELSESGCITVVPINGGFCRVF